mmetsp:Transcript_28149/g.72370  ORF Transcript_28149/g.72370 Transcript_28149/m.72370 type:complete len:88 (-) Transcript_28149:1083-1346(-)
MPAVSRSSTPTLDNCFLTTSKPYSCSPSWICTLPTPQKPEACSLAQSRIFGPGSFPKLDGSRWCSGRITQQGHLLVLLRMPGGPPAH